MAAPEVTDHRMRPREPIAVFAGTPMTSPPAGNAWFAI